VTIYWWRYRSAIYNFYNNIRKLAKTRPQFLTKDLAVIVWSYLDSRPSQTQIANGPMPKEIGDSENQNRTPPEVFKANMLKPVITKESRFKEQLLKAQVLGTPTPMSSRLEAQVGPSQKRRSIMEYFKNSEPKTYTTGGSSSSLDAVTPTPRPTTMSTMLCEYDSDEEVPRPSSLTPET
jgi:hypothetical protein